METKWKEVEGRQVLTTAGNGVLLEPKLLTYVTVSLAILITFNSSLNFHTIASLSPPAQKDSVLSVYSFNSRS